MKRLKARKTEWLKARPGSPGWGLLLLVLVPGAGLLGDGCTEPQGRLGEPCTAKGFCELGLICVEGTCREIEEGEGQGEGEEEGVGKGEGEGVVCLPIGQTDSTCDGVDDDCDGQTDEEYGSRITECGQGACFIRGRSTCVAGREQENCTPGQPFPDDRQCDGVDEDCDGETDEDYSGETACGQGWCREHASPAVCVAGVIVLCTPGVPLGPEDATCDGVDDDCDGQTDEEYRSRSSECGQGACSNWGRTSCSDGREQQNCTPGEPAPDDRHCDGVDEDCDGETDEDYVGVMSCGQGWCRAHSSPAMCVAAEIVSCTPGAPLSWEDITCDGVDDDCDGSADEEYRGFRCGEGVCNVNSWCVQGEERCPQPEPETCDGLDNDCDGSADEGCNGCPAGTVVPEGWVCAPAGTFMMGSPESELGRDSDEGPQHEVTLTRPFLIQVTELTQGQWREVMQDIEGYQDPSGFPVCGDDCPVEQVSWYEMVTYCNRLSEQDGFEPCYFDLDDETPYTWEDAQEEKVPGWPDGAACTGYRLPTEAEWEYAARAGDTRATYNGDLDGLHLGCEQPNDVIDGIAWFCGNGPETTHTVGQKVPNAWGLYDILGNVWEWCWDWKAAYSPEGSSEQDPIGAPTGAKRVGRGGSWQEQARYLRSANRGNPAFGPYNFYGFRPVRTAPPS